MWVTMITLGLDIAIWRVHTDFAQITFYIRYCCTTHKPSLAGEICSYILPCLAHPNTVDKYQELYLASLGHRIKRNSIFLWWPPHTLLVIAKSVTRQLIFFIYNLSVKGMYDWDVESMSWWRHQMETFSALLTLCAGNSPFSGEFPSQRPVARSFNVFFDICMNKWLSKQSWGWCFFTPSCPLWRHCDVPVRKYFDY